jgi:hypothetical protein
MLVMALLPSPARADVPLEARTARPASDVTDGFGVIAHLAYSTTPYVTRFPEVAQRLEQLGVKRIRSRLYPSNTGQHQRMLTLCRDHGIKFNVVVGTPLSGEVAEIHNLVATTLAGCIESVEGANEWNLSGRTSWASELLAHQRELWDTFRGDSRTAGLPILAPALGKTIEADFQALGATGINQYVSRGNIHLYPGGRIPSDRLSTTLDWERQYVLRGNTLKPIVTTEAGYHNAMNAPDGGHLPTSEKAAGIYHPRLLMEHLSRGAIKMFNYEFLDQELDQLDPEHNFGLIRHDLSPKPSFNALRNTLAVFQDSVRAAPGTLTYGIESIVPVQHAAFRMSDGSFIVALWRDVSVYDRTTRTDLTVDPVSVKLVLQEAAWVTTYRPSVQAAAINTSTTKVLGRTFQMPGDLYLIHVYQ